MLHNMLNAVRSTMSTLLVIGAATLSLPAASTPLTGMGDLPFPGDTGPPDRINPIYVDTVGRPFTGTWDTTAALDWRGTFTGTPVRTNVGTYTMNFSGLKRNFLPENSFFILGDLDRGSSSGEIISLRAWDLMDRLITTAWLDVPTYQDGIDDPQLAEMLPDFKWDDTNGIYSFDGNGETWSGNPSTAVFMHNNQQLLRLEVDDRTAFAGFGIAAPPSVVSEPATVGVLWASLATLIFLRRRRA